MKAFAALAAIFLVLSASAQTAYHAQIDGILQILDADDYSVRMSGTNALDALCAVTTNRREQATCKVLKAILLLKCAEEEVSDEAFHESTNLLSCVERDLADAPDAWQLYWAMWMKAEANILDGRADLALGIATNAINRLDAQGHVQIESNVWNVVMSDFESASTSLRGILQETATECRAKLAQ